MSRKMKKWASEPASEKMSGWNDPMWHGQGDYTHNHWAKCDTCEANNKEILGIQSISTKRHFVAIGMLRVCAGKWKSKSALEIDVWRKEGNEERWRASGSGYNKKEVRTIWCGTTYEVSVCVFATPEISPWYNSAHKTDAMHEVRRCDVARIVRHIVVRDNLIVGHCIFFFVPSQQW